MRYYFHSYAIVAILIAIVFTDILGYTYFEYLNIRMNILLYNIRMGVLRLRFLRAANFTSIENKFSLTGRRKNFHDDWRKEKLIDSREAYCGVRLTAHFPRLAVSATFHNIDAKDAEQQRSSCLIPIPFTDRLIKGREIALTRD